ncbi:crotonase/enoyl-CoA hydratase family protein [Paraburkholderia sp. MMS20-SJTR3]|uniref:Crotonase/enoyl-CoA hydratase family protein n=1 Tax=Paraburkholderia sejongensis TaxID=2886946 RepID=A0ABS8K170_9BURK|nr:crotonase/enoyl-CoA hydratase family protein [Paraburkholderia sp. MMS20-SJTR3]MCC8395838.1 crotonase/enoyl-CoA hydratase family protein [Paraburkholderia sp. MMS20-SJTR3]
MSETLVTYELDGAVALIGLNRPDKRNAINEEVIAQLRDAVNRAGDEAMCAVLFGHGGNFSAGLDLREALARASGQSAPPKKRRRHSWHEVFDIIARGPIPFVAALHGAVVGGGLELATAAHVRVGDQTCFFGLPEGQRGIFVGGGGTVRIQRVVGYTMMADMMLTGRLLTAEEGQREHIITYLTEPGGALAKARELAAKIAQNVPDTNWRITNLLPRVNDLSHEDGLFLEYMSSNMMRSPETSARLQHFVDGNARLVKPE